MVPGRKFTRKYTAEPGIGGKEGVRRGAEDAERGRVRGKGERERGVCSEQGKRGKGQRLRPPVTHCGFSQLRVNRQGRLRRRTIRNCLDLVM